MKHNHGPVTVYRPDPVTGELVPVATKVPAQGKPGKPHKLVGLWDDQTQSWDWIGSHVALRERGIPDKRSGLWVAAYGGEYRPIEPNRADWELLGVDGQ